VNARRLLLRVSKAGLAFGLLSVGGCLAALEHNLDLILSPGAVENALVLPYSAVAGLARLFARLWYG
jgi:hypothetical protein